MLQLLKNQVVTSVAKQQVQIRQLELDWYTNNYWTLSQQAALLAGFAFTQITTSLPSDLSFSLEMSYLIFAAVSLGLQLCVIITATFCCMWGPGLALRGPDGAYSVEEAIKSLKEEQGVIFSLFIAGMLSFFISNMLLLWCYYDTFVAAAATLLFASFLCLLLYFAVSLFIQLRVSSSIAVEGGIDALKVYADIKDLDACCTSPVLAADPADAAAAAAAAPATAAASPAAQAAAAAAERGRGTSFRPEQQPPSDESLFALQGETIEGTPQGFLGSLLQLFDVE